MPSTLKKLLEQVHRRSLWQILVAYGAGSYALLGGVDTLGNIVGIPDWVSPAVFVVCLSGLPLVLFTAFVQARGIGGPELVAGVPEKGIRRWFNWRNLAVAAGAALALLATGTGGYMGARVLGIGPVGTLIAKGLIQEQARILVSELESSPDDSITAAALSDAIRIDLHQSQKISVVDVEEVATTLAAMELPPGTPLTVQVARDAAAREGIPVLLVGNLRRPGNAWQISIRLIALERDTVLWADQETVASEADLWGTTQDPGPVERLVGRLMERVGESLWQVRNRTPLPLLTTSSLDALKQYVQGDHAWQFERDLQKALMHTEEALALDSTFAEAWRRLGMILHASYTDRQRELEAVTRAYQLSDRLPEAERLHIEATYFFTVEIDYQRAIDAQERLVALAPEVGGWHNLAYLYRQTGQFERARQAMEERVKYEVSDAGMEDFIRDAILVGDLDMARRGLEMRSEHLPGHPNNPTWEAEVAYAAGDRAEVRRIYRSALETTGARFWRNYLDRLEVLEGRPSTWEQHHPDSPVTQAHVEFWVRLQPERAAALIEEYMEGQDYSDRPPVNRPYLSHAGYWALAGRAREAQEALNNWRASTPEGRQPLDRASELNTQGRIALAEGKTEAGLDFLRQAVVAGPGLPKFGGHLAWAYDQAQMPDSALAAYHRYLEAPSWGRLNWGGSNDGYYLARTYERLGQLHEARGELEEAAKYHALFVDLWSDADPDLQPRVQAARAALARLESRGPGN